MGFAGFFTRLLPSAQLGALRRASSCCRCRRAVWHCGWRAKTGSAHTLLTQMAREKKFNAAHCAVGSRPITRAEAEAEADVGAGVGDGARAAVVLSGGIEATHGLSGAVRSGGVDNSAIAASAAARAAVSRSLRWLGTVADEANGFAVSPAPVPVPAPCAVAAWTVPTDEPARMRAAADCPMYHINPIASSSASTSPPASERPIGVTWIFNLRWVESVDSTGGRSFASPPFRLAGAVARPGTA